MGVINSFRKSAFLIGVGADLGVPPPFRPRDVFDC